MLDEKFLLGVKITNAKKEEILEYILQSLKNLGEKYYIITPNPEILVYANKHKGFKEILNHARLGLCDGIGVIWGGKILGINFKQRIAGTDFLESLCKKVSEKPITVGFLGAGPKIAERTAECLRLRYPKLKVSFAAQEWSISNKNSPEGFKNYDLRIKNEEKKIINHKSYIINQSIDILFVAFGFPKQEEWIARNLPHLPVRIAIGVGGAFDFISGNVPRAPVFLRKLGLEWLYRLIRQPWRIKRQLALLEFIFLVLKGKIKLI